MKITVITQPYCEWCTKTRDLLEEHPHTIVDLTGQGGTSLRRFLEGQNIRSVPAVFVDGTHIGGYEGVREWLAQHTTNPYVKESVAHE